MTTNADRIFPFYQMLYDKYLEEDFIVDRSGQKVVEILASRIPLDPKEEIINFKTRKTPKKYVEKESQWYHSHELKIDQVKDISIWSQVSDINGEINSNYGNLVYSRNNFSQFSNVLNILKTHKESRQAIIIYTRPSIHYEWNSLDATDFICTNYQHFFIRNNELTCITNMRSNDCWTGTFNDIPWFHSVINNMYNQLLTIYSDLKLGYNIFIPNSFHCYERNFKDLEKLVESYEEK